MMKRLALPGICLALVACAPAKPELHTSPQSLREVACVAVLPFDNITLTSSAGESFADQVSVSLRTAGFQVMDRSEAARILSHHRIFVDRVGDAEDATALADLLGVRGVVFGTIEQYGWDRRSKGPGLQAEVVAKVSLAEVSSGKVLWSSTVSGTGKRSFGPRPAPLFAAAGEAADLLGAQLAASLEGPANGGATPCWQDAAKPVLASLAPSAKHGGLSATPTPVATATPAATPPPIVLTPAQKALAAKLAAGGSFVLEGVAFTGMTDNLKPGASAPLADLAQVLKWSSETRIDVEAYVDALDKDAAALSTRRATVVAAKLVALGASSKQFKAKGMAGANPLMPSFTEITRAKNRRIEIKVVHGPAMPAAARKPRVKVVAAPGGQLTALQIHGLLKKNPDFRVDKRVTQTRTKRPTTIYYRPGQKANAAKIAKTMKKKPRARVSNKLPHGVDIYILVGGAK